MCTNFMDKYTRRMRKELWRFILINTKKKIHVNTVNSKNTLTLIKFMHFGLWVLYFLCVCVCFCAIFSYVRCNVMCIIEPVSCKHCPNKSQHELVFTEDKPTEKKIIVHASQFCLQIDHCLKFHCSLAVLCAHLTMFHCQFIGNIVVYSGNREIASSTRRLKAKRSHENESN